MKALINKEAGLIVVLFIGVFLSTMWFAGMAKSTEEEIHELSVGGMTFEKPDGWKHDKEAVAASGRSVDGVAEALIYGCDKKSKKSCSAPVSMSYLKLDGEGELPVFSVLERSLDRGYKMRFDGFRKKEAISRVTTNGVHYLRYEFSYRQDRKDWTQIVATYDVNDQPIAVIANGPSKSVEGQRDEILAMFEHAADDTSSSSH